jgi:hypothetical protein
MSGRIVVLALAISLLLSTAAMAASPAVPGAGGQAIAGTAAAARAADSAAGLPGASSWGGARAAVAQGDFGSLTNHDVNVIAKDANGGAPAPGKP